MSVVFQIMAASGLDAMVRQRIDEGWRFHRGDAVGAEAELYPDESWRRLSLPHDWSIESAYSPDNKPQNAWLPGGVGWYRRSFEISKEQLKQKVLVRFDGVYMNSRVWLNGHKVGGRPYGFMTFSCDLSDYLHEGTNVLAVRVDNTPAPTSRFYHGSGIYGHVDLLMLPSVFVVPDGGIFVRTVKLDGSRAEIEVDTEICNLKDEARTITLQQRVIDRDGACVAESPARRINLKARLTQSTACRIEIANAEPWSPDSPVLYQLETLVKQSGKTVDRRQTSFGIRTVAFRPDSGFWLNGKNIKIRGVCEHLELGVCGLAVPDDLMAWRIKMLKSMGCNAIRTAHNPFTPTFYDMCDRLGMMVVDEIFDGWHKKGANDYGGRFFADWWRRDVTDWVRRDRNHPSVILYSIGNETGHTDKYNITGLIHKLDPSRFTTGGAVLKGVDVAGFNGGGGKNGVLEAFHAKNPERPVVLTEVPHTLQTRGCYRVKTWWRDGINKSVHQFTPYGTRQIFFGGNARYRSSYDNCGVRINARTCWKRTRDTPWISGEFRWTGFDCLGEAQFMGAEFPKRNYNSGVIDLAGFPKDLFYFYQSQWTSAPMLHLLPHWTHPGLQPGTPIPVVGYSNCDEVELWLNGRSLGRKQPGDLLDFVWRVPWQPGRLKAVAYRNGKAVVETNVVTADSPVQLRLDITRFPRMAPLNNPMAPVTILLTVAAVDSVGTEVPWVDNRVQFRLSGPIDLLGYENGNPVDGTAHHESWRNLFYGLMRGFYRVEHDNTPAIVTVAVILGKRVFEKETMVAIDCRQAILQGARPAFRPIIYYTVDGSKPTTSSLRYKGPFTISTSTTIRGLILYGDHEQLTIRENFTRGH